MSGDIMAALVEQVRAGVLPAHQAIRIGSALGLESAAIMLPCEAPGCTAVVSLANAYSMAAVYRMPGPGKGAYQCASEQHFACSHLHAKLALLNCLDTHIEQGDHA